MKLSVSWKHQVGLPYYMREYDTCFNVMKNSMMSVIDRRATSVNRRNKGIETLRAEIKRRSDCIGIGNWHQLFTSAPSSGGSTSLKVVEGVEKQRRSIRSTESLHDNYRTQGENYTSRFICKATPKQGK